MQILPFTPPVVISQTEVNVVVRVASPPDFVPVGPFGSIDAETECQYDAGGNVIGAVMTIAIPPISKPYGAPLTYTWTASNGSIAGSGPTAKWTRLIDSGRIAAGEATLTVTDGTEGADILEQGWGLIEWSQCE